jgi:hypothetical protein
MIQGDKDRRTLQKTRAQELMRQADLEQHLGLIGLVQLDQLQDALGDDYQLKVFGAEQMNSLIWKGKNIIFYRRRIFTRFFK